MRRFSVKYAAPKATPTIPITLSPKPSPLPMIFEIANWKPVIPSQPPYKTTSPTTMKISLKPLKSSKGSSFAKVSWR